MISLLELPALRREIVGAEKELIFTQTPSPLVAEHTRSIRKAELYWASRGMTQLAIGTAPEMPEWTPAIAAPTPSGFMWFATPIGTSPTMPPSVLGGSFLGTSHVQGAHWTVSQGNVLILTFYGTCQDVEQRALTAPITRDVYEIGTTQLAANATFAPGSTAIEPWVSKVIHTLGAAWILMQQPTVATTRRTRGRGAGVGGKKKPPKTSLVQVIELRRLAHKHSEEKGHATREYHTRWMVRGHWRQQRVGPGRRYVRPVYVAPYIKGPEDAPLKTDRVSAWRR